VESPLEKFNINYAILDQKAQQHCEQHFSKSVIY